MKSIARSSAGVIAIAFGVAIAPGCRLARFAHSDCVLGDGEKRPTKTAKKVDLSLLKLYRNTFAVSRVGPFEDHFTVWFRDIEPEFLQLRAKEDPTGELHIEVDNGMWGGIGSPPKDPKAPPPNVAALQETLENEAQRRCPDVRDWVFQYDGAYREIDLQETINVTKTATSESVGWKGRVTLTADESLTSILPGSPNYESGLGLFDLHEPVQWVAFTPPSNEMGSVLFVDRLMKTKVAPPAGSLDGALLGKTLEAARRFRDHAPSPTLAEIVATQGSTLLPLGMEQRMNVELDVYARANEPKNAHDGHFVLPLKTSAIVKGTAQGETEQDIGNLHLKMRAAFSSISQTDPTRFEGALAIHVEDRNGHVFDRSYPAKAELLVDGPTVVIPNGIQISDPSIPATERQFHGTFPETGEIESVDFYVGLKEDPREP